MKDSRDFTIAVAEELRRIASLAFALGSSCWDDNRTAFNELGEAARVLSQTCYRYSDELREVKKS